MAQKGRGVAGALFPVVPAVRLVRRPVRWLSQYRTVLHMLHCGIFAVATLPQFPRTSAVFPQSQVVCRGFGRDWRASTCSRAPGGGIVHLQLCRIVLSMVKSGCRS